VNLSVSSLSFASRNPPTSFDARKISDYLSQVPAVVQQFSEAAKRQA
jgi:hypothetical protein